MPRKRVYKYRYRKYIRKKPSTPIKRKSTEESVIRQLWYSMKKRCYDPRQVHYDDYGGRGIKVCDRWLNSFEDFYKDVGNRPSLEHSIDR